MVCFSMSTFSDLARIGDLLRDPWAMEKACFSLWLLRMTMHDCGAPCHELLLFDCWPVSVTESISVCSRQGFSWSSRGLAAAVGPALALLDQYCCAQPAMRGLKAFCLVPCRYAMAVQEAAVKFVRWARYRRSNVLAPDRPLTSAHATPKKFSV